jgi:hypothetical protein
MAKQNRKSESGRAPEPASRGKHGCHRSKFDATKREFIVNK